MRIFVFIFLLITVPKFALACSCLWIPYEKRVEDSNIIVITELKRSISINPVSWAVKKYDFKIIDTLKGDVANDVSLKSVEVVPYIFRLSCDLDLSNKEKWILFLDNVNDSIFIKQCSRHIKVDSQNLSFWKEKIYRIIDNNKKQKK